MKKVELLAPCNTLTKAQIAIEAGADAIYIGGNKYSLRSRASSLNIDDLREISEYVHLKNKKMYVTVNMVFHDENLNGLREYLKDLDDIGVDAVIVSSVGIALMVKKYTRMEAHISTQLSVNNTGAISFLKHMKCDRVVLARESSIDDIKQVLSKTSLPIEVFIHGGMCSNYSGKCSLSNRMSLRDANRGGCAHSCRWSYDIFQGENNITDANTKFSFSSKDLRAINYIEEMINAGVASFKIEGRMKSENYIRQVVRTYRVLIDAIYARKHIRKEDLKCFHDELDKTESRVSDEGFLGGVSNHNQTLYGVNGAGVNHDYVGIVLDFEEKAKLAKVLVKNKFNLGDIIEVVTPKYDLPVFKNSSCFDIKCRWLLKQTCNNPAEIVLLRTPYKVSKNYLIRKISK